MSTTISTNIFKAHFWSGGLLKSTQEHVKVPISFSLPPLFHIPASSLFLFLSPPIDASSKTGASPHQHQRMNEFNLNLPNDPGPPALVGCPSPRGGLSLLGCLLLLRSEQNASFATSYSFASFAAALTE